MTDIRCTPDATAHAAVLACALRLGLQRVSVRVAAAGLPSAAGIALESARRS